MDQMWQLVSDMRESLFSFCDPLIPPLLLFTPFSTSCDEEVELLEGCVGGNGKSQWRKRRKRAVSTHDFHHCAPPSSSCWASASCQCAGQAEAPHSRQVQTSACDRLGETAARGMQGLVPAVLLQRLYLAGLSTQTSSRFCLSHSTVVSSCFYFLCGGTFQYPYILLWILIRTDPNKQSRNLYFTVECLQSFNVKSSKLIDFRASTFHNVIAWNSLWW